jgi:hypothetical protein
MDKINKIDSDEKNNINKLEINNEINSHFEKNYNFKNPIEYNNKTRILDENIIKTLELVDSIDKNEISIYENIFLTNNYPSKLSMRQMAKYYTTDNKYLEQTQQLIKSIDCKNIIRDNNIDLALTYYDEIKKETGFHEKYFYFDFEFAKQFNKNQMAMTFSSIYNIMSPIISLCVPILILILPIILIKLQGKDFNLSEYVNILKPLIQKTSLGSLFMNFESSDGTKKIYLVLSALFYCFSIYQNILSCVRFYSNIQKIYSYLLTFKSYIDNTLLNIKYFSSLLKQHDTYNVFTKELQDKETQLKIIYEDFKNIESFEVNYNNILEIGKIMTTFYKLYDDDIYDQLFIYSFGFNGYLHNLLNINEQVVNNKLHKAKYISKNKCQEEEIETEKLETEKLETKKLETEKLETEKTETEKLETEKLETEKLETEKLETEKLETEKTETKKLETEKLESKQKSNNKNKNKNKKIKLIVENIFYPKFINSQEIIVKNDFNLDKNIILTGPNASGKTTFIKSLFLNILLSQQIGYGCFKKINFIPYDYFHCYLNIPDTSGRDSLFQAEARQCKNILDFINDNDSDETHFCIFDELYSGTNPDDAIISANAFIKYISSLDNVCFSLTTHYVNLCEKIKEYSKINNCHMGTINNKETNDVEYTYKLLDGISQVKCGLQILKNMKYPSDILENLEK